MRSKHWNLAAFVLLAALAHAAHAILPIQHWETQRGARVYFVENHDLPMLDVSVDFPAGAGFDTSEQSGRASLTAHMLRLGIKGLDENEISRRLADVGALLNGRFDADRAGVGVRTLTSAKERQEALGLLARILATPEFPASVLEREKARIVANLKEADTKPDTIAARTFSRSLYPTHPYGLRGAGEVATVSRLTRDDLASFHRTHYTVERAVIAITGDVSRQEAGAIAEALTAALPSTSMAAPAVPPVAAPPQAIERWVPHHATQSHILIGTTGMRRDDPDYFPLLVGNHVLGGGGFTSRITEEVRQKRGLAYSAYSYFQPMLREGPFVVGMQTEAAQARSALEVVRKTVADFVAQGPTAKELTASKKNIIGGFPLRIDSNRKIHEYIALIGFYRLPLTYLDDFTKNVERVTVEQVKAAFQRRIDPQRMVTVVVGPSGEKTAERPN
ncbi:MAG TPA: pitrilysin family protein [Burkholderiales bacterium]|nr:pitrilysin family protein [Burkholderiales bacterium]